MKQKKSPYGNINIAGGKSGPAMIYNNRSKDFLDEVEEGIKPIIEACIANEIDTFNSCEGHRYPDGEQDVRNFDVVISEKHKGDWIAYIDNINRKYNLKIYTEVYGLLNTDVINKVYENPVRFKIIFDGNEEEVEQATKIIEQSILNKEFPGSN